MSERIKIEPKLPFNARPVSDLLETVKKLEGEMSVRTLSTHEWLIRTAKGNENWLLSPETGLMDTLSMIYLSGAKLPDGEVGEILDNRAEKEWQNAGKPEDKDSFKSEYIQRAKQRLSQPEILLGEFVEEVKKGDAHIGRKDKGFVDVNVIEISKGGKSHSYVLVDEEPMYSKEYRKRHPLGIIVLPYYVDEKGDYYVNIVARNEQGAINAGGVLIAQEQTSLSKILVEAAIEQPGMNAIAACVQDFGTVDCEKVPGLEELRKRTRHIMVYDNTARLGGGFKLAAAVKMEDTDTDLLKKYGENWYKLDDVTRLLDETNTKQPLANDFLVDCLFLVQSERVEQMQAILNDSVKLRERLNTIEGLGR